MSTIQLRSLVERLADRDMTLSLTDAAKTWLAETGYDPIYGARPLKRVIQRAIQDPLSLKILEGSLSAGGEVLVDHLDGAEGLTLSALDGPALAEAA